MTDHSTKLKNNTLKEFGLVAFYGMNKDVL